MKNTILIAIGQANTEPWTTIWKEGQEKTWIKDDVYGSNVVNYQSKHAPFLIKKLDEIHEKNRYRKRLGLWQGRFDKIITKFISRKIPKYSFNSIQQILTVNSWSTNYLYGQRKIALYDWFLRCTDRDFLFTTNTSSYINQKNLLKIIQNFDPSEAIYAGRLFLTGESSEFVSGAGTLLSRKSVEVIKDNWHKHSHETLEDVTLGRFMKSMGIPAISLSTILLPTPAEAKALSEPILDTEFHFRCKSDEIPRKDVEIMQILHKKVKKIH